MKTQARFDTQTISLLMEARKRVAYIDIILLWHAWNSSQHTLRGRRDEKLGKNRVLLQAIRKRDAANRALALGVRSPHRSSDVSTCNGLDENGASTLNNPHQRMWYLENVRPSQPSCLEKLEPVRRDGLNV